MGGGVKRTADVQKARPVSLSTGVDPIRALASTGSGLRQAADFCARTHTVLVVLNAGADPPAQGTAVRLAETGGTLRAVTDAGQLGEIPGPAARALVACLTLGFELAGEVEAIDREAGTARLEITGRRADSA